MPSNSEIKNAVTTALGVHGGAANAEEQATLAQLVRGQFNTAIGQPPLDQVGGKIVEIFLLGRTDMPPDGHRPQLRSLAKSGFTTFDLPAPSAVLVEVLVDVVIGWMIDHSLPIPPGGRAVVMHNVVGLYLAGAS